MIAENSKADAITTVRTMLHLIGEDPDREGLKDTPERVLRSWEELFGGYQADVGKILSTEFSKDGYDEMIVCRDIEFYSTCEHHLQPFFGTAHVGYIPNKTIVGLSKLARLVDAFARRLQIQERLTEQIACALEEHLTPIGTGVVIEAKHFCMICRGVRKQNSIMVTSSLKGAMRDGARAEFLRLIEH